MVVETIYTDTPVNKQIAINLDELKSYKDDETSAVNYKLKIKCSNSQKKILKEDELIRIWKLNNPNSCDVKIMYDIEKEKNVRSESILSMKTNSDRLREYLNINDIKTDESIYPMLQEIEDNSVIQYNKPKHSFTLLSVRIKGAIGLKKLYASNEVYINLEEYPQGLIAITGKYGSGKSTILENCQPYLKMLTRTGKLQNHFFLKDSYRKLLYVDETNTYYSIEILIDGQTEDRNGNKTGKIKSFVAVGKDRDNLTPLEECNGNNDEFETWVDNNFGNIETFLRTSFFTRGRMNGVDDIIYTTKGEKKAFFSTLIGLDELSKISEAAKERQKDIDKTIQIKESVYENNSDTFNKEDIQNNIFAEEEKLSEIDETRNLIEKELSYIQKELISVDDSSINNIKSELTAIDEKITQLTENKNFLEEFNSNQSTFNELLAVYEKKDELLVDIQSLEKQISSEEKSYRDIESQIRKLEKECDRHLSFEKLQEKSIPDSINDSCPTCGQKLPKNKIEELQSSVDAIKAEIENAKKEREVIEKNLSERNKTLKDHKFNSLKIKKEALNSQLEELQSELQNAFYSKNTILSMTEKVKLIPRLEVIEKELTELTDKKESLIQKLESFDSEVIESLKSKAQNHKKELESLNSEKNNVLKNIGALRNSLELALKKEAENAALQSEIIKLNSISEKYAILVKAFGANGILALELEAFSPEVSALTNQILDVCFGGEYKVSFQTLRTSSNGKLLEEFSVLVENTSTGNIRPLEWVSGGEGVIIKEALYNAFSIIREKSTGFSLKTKFMDEMDSSIDPATRPLYLKMIKTVFEMENCSHVLLITHSSELKEVIESKIEL